MKLEELIPNDSNPRRIKKDKLDKLKKSIENFPKMMEIRPIVIDDENIIIAGNMRYKAISDLGIKKIPDNWVKKVSDLSEEEKKRFIVSDNKTFGEWDWDELANQYDVDELLEFGFDEWEFQDFEEEKEEVVSKKDTLESGNKKITVECRQEDHHDICSMIQKVLSETSLEYKITQ